MDATLGADFLAWFVLVVLFTAYTRNMQETTFALGRSLVKASEGAGVQDAITPKWQTRNNVLMIVGLGLYLIVCLYVFVWYWGVLIFLATFFLAIPIASRLLVPRPMSRHFMARIHKDLKRRHGEFIEAGDQLRAEAVRELLERFPTEAEVAQP